MRDEFRLLDKTEGRFFALLRLCVRQKSSHQSATPLKKIIDNLSPVMLLLVF
ncbi:hypothetical protein FDUTEX481_07636 [Tolypothrix sp. PCC 7601]|nr:hypothetical protein FDUTEX481_07636 [Tolypothrix sp. PCC 7601]